MWNPLDKIYQEWTGRWLIFWLIWLGFFIALWLADKFAHITEEIKRAEREFENQEKIRNGS